MHHYTNTAGSGVAESLAADWHCRGLAGTYGGPADQPWEATLRIEVADDRLQITMILADGRVAFVSQGATVSPTASGVRLQYLYANRAQAGHHDPEASYGQADLAFAGDTGQGSLGLVLTRYRVYSIQYVYSTDCLEVLARPGERLSGVGWEWS